MRRILIDHARSLRAKKKVSGQRVDLDEALLFTEAKSDALIALDLALEALETRQPRQCKVVELYYFAGLNFDETAAALGVSSKTVKRDWKVARAWLYGELEG
jgi:RNA polymerase sigma factor (TIGR02999 family)